MHMSPVQLHTAWFTKKDGEVFPAKVQTYCADGIDEIKAAFIDNPHFVGVTSPFQDRKKNEEVLRKVSRLSVLFAIRK